MYHLIMIINVIITCIVSLLFSSWFAAGFISESNSPETFVAPEFFFIMAVWAIGLGLYVVRAIVKSNSPALKLSLTITSLLLMWGALPIGAELVTTILLPLR
ncbi:hypothetical protein ACE1TF_14595 [Geomicrobium sp. JSM 1781026]|uniref:hypothetical protein n=1 Tax=unclassified Geomicrobium TaxID=2628951 RepID=UPI0005AA7870|nr:hypothetical protein [Geomicrobium sp. JCM 19037]